MSDLTDRLRSIASKATAGRWRYHQPRGVGRGLPGQGNGFVIYPFDGHYGGVEQEADAAHIATFDPVTVAAMLAVIDAAEYRLSKDDTCWCPDPADDDTVCGSCREREALARFRQVAG